MSNLKPSTVVLRVILALLIFILLATLGYFIATKTGTISTTAAAAWVRILWMVSIAMILLIIVFAVGTVLTKPNKNASTVFLGLLLIALFTIALGGAAYGVSTKMGFSIPNALGLATTQQVLINNHRSVAGDTYVTNILGNATNATLSRLVGFTTSQYNGNITSGTLSGYTAANAICTTQFSGSHFCTTSEILGTIITNTSSTGTAWITNGPPGYTANANDCLGWTVSTNTFLGSFWNFDATPGGGAGYLTNCAQQKTLSCCGATP